MKNISLLAQVNRSAHTYETSSLTIEDWKNLIIEMYEQVLQDIRVQRKSGPTRIYSGKIKRKSLHKNTSRY